MSTIEEIRKRAAEAGARMQAEREALRMAERKELEERNSALTERLNAALPPRVTTPTQHASALAASLAASTTTERAMALDDILAALRTLTPDQLSEVSDAIQAQRQFFARRRLRSIRPGDTVRFASHIRPTYLAGLTATIVDINRTRVRVKCPNDPRYGRFAGGMGVTVPIGLIE